MCGIIGTFSNRKLKELVELNAYRGQHSHSFVLYNLASKQVEFMHKSFGALDVEEKRYNIPKDCYAIAHIQAPTTENISEAHIHPAITKTHMLWHNGILKPETIKYLQEETEDLTTWDTMLLCKHLALTPYPVDIDGSFACVMTERMHNGQNQVYAFRNEIAPLFFDVDMNISSTRFDGCQPVMANVFYGVGLDVKELLPLGYFNTVDNPYVIP